MRKLCAEGTAILYTTHYLEEAETLCSRIGIIDHGKLLAEGTLSELQKRLGGDQLFVLECVRFIGAFRPARDGPRFMVLMHARNEWMVSMNRPTPNPSEEGNCVERRSVEALNENAEWEVTLLHKANIEHPTSNIQHRTSNIEHPTSNIQHRTSNIQHPTSNIQHPTSNLEPGTHP